MWITYSVRYSTSMSPVDHEPPTYRDIAVFTDELAALRYANDTGAKAIQIAPGETLEEAIEAQRR